MGNYIIDNNLKRSHTIVNSTAPKTYWSFGHDIENSEVFDLINICPKNFNKFENDCSFGVLSSDGKRHYHEGYFVNIPTIEIREYLMDLPEDRWLDIFMQTYSDMVPVIEKLKNGNKDEIAEKFQSIGKSFTDGTFIQKLMSKVRSSGSNPFPMNKNDDQAMILAYDFVVFCYRKLMSYDITNYYQLPYNGKIEIGSNGTTGWRTKKGLPGDIKLLSQINIDTYPMWRYEGENSDSIQFELNLFNDTYNSMVSNFRFVHTIIPNNMWTQYGLFQHNPCVYDIQFEGGLRYFCCSLDIKCENIGNSRIPPDGFFEDVIMNSVKKDEIFRIPDVYKITFNFKSLLPNNFNQYMMTYNEQDKIINDAGAGYFGRQETAMAALADSISQTISEIKTEQAVKESTESVVNQSKQTMEKTVENYGKGSTWSGNIKQESIFGVKIPSVTDTFNTGVFR